MSTPTRTNHFDIQPACQEKLDRTQFVVEASDGELMLLWEKYSNQATHKTTFSCYTWEQDYVGSMVTVGEFMGYPVNISLRWFTINGVFVMFWEPISMVSHHTMIHDWLEKNCAPRWCNGTRLAHCNGMNFHLLLNYIERPEER